jgi:predicted deacylase
MLNPDWRLTRITTNLDFMAEGLHCGDLRLKWSNDDMPLGYWPVPAAVCVRGQGPTLLLAGGTHGDEFEGPTAIMRLLRRLPELRFEGRLILLPALNAPAVARSARVSPLDGANLNRAFPGDANGGPTAMIAHLLESVLLPVCDAAIDFHSGGKASVFADSALATRCEDPVLHRANLALAHAFAAPFIWVLGEHNDDRSVNAAAKRQRVPMIATELSGGGGVDRASVSLADDGILRCMRHLGMIEAAPAAEHTPRLVEIASPEHTLYAPCQGLFLPCFDAGDEVAAHAPAGTLYPLFEPERPAVAVSFPVSGIVLSRINRGFVERGEMLATIATPYREAGS